MFIILLSFVYVINSEVSVDHVHHKGFQINLNPSQILGSRIYWAATLSDVNLSGKEIMNGVTTLNCAGKATRNQLLKNSWIQAACPIENGKTYVVHVLSVHEDAHETFQVEFTGFTETRRRLLQTPSAFPTTGAPTSSNMVEPSAKPSSAPITMSPTSNGASMSPSVSPSIAAIGVISTEIPANEESTFAGLFNFSSSEGVGFVVGTGSAFIFLVVLVLAGPCLYRRYHQRTALPEEDKVTKSQAKLSTLVKNHMASSVQSLVSESSYEILVTPFKSEDKIRMAEPCE